MTYTDDRADEVVEPKEPDPEDGVMKGWWEYSWVRHAIEERWLDHRPVVWGCRGCAAGGQLPSPTR